MNKTRKILFVCMGNICRSPTAEGVFKTLAQKDKRLPELFVDSCGTIGYHAGEPPDPRSVAASKLRGYDLSAIRSRKITQHDLEYFDLVLVMDKENLSNTRNLIDKDHANQQKIKLFLDFAKESTVSSVPDPYYGGESGFDDVIDLIEQASRGLIEYLA